MLEMKKIQTITTSAGKTYTVSLYSSWLNGEITSTETERTYPFTPIDAETLEEAFTEATEWCERHSADDARCEVYDEGIWRVL